MPSWVLLRLLGVGAVLALLGGSPAPADAMPPLPGEDEFPVAAAESSAPALPVSLHRQSGDRVFLRLAHPRAEELGLEGGFLGLRLGPVSSPRSMELTSPSAVPEPSTGLLVGLTGAVALLARRERRG